MMQFLARMFGAAALNARTYEEVEADRSANVQALVVVLLSAVAAGLGARGFGLAPSFLPRMVLIALLSWAAWALLTYQIGARLMPEAGTRSDFGEMMRTIGFSSAPGLLRVFGVVPALAPLVFAVTTVWMLLSMVVAIRQALDYTSTARAVAVCLIGWILTALMVLGIGALTAPVF